MYLGLDRGHFLSPTGGCRPFDASADGYCRAEGCGVFILKRYADALQENDKIYGLIKGIELNQSGNAHSITHPHSETQVQLFQRLLQKSKIEPSTISAVEAHGTGTQVSMTSSCQMSYLVRCRINPGTRLEMPERLPPSRLPLQALAQQINHWSSAQ